MGLLCRIASPAGPAWTVTEIGEAADSELPHLAFKSIGIDLGQEQRLSDLHMDSTAAAALLAERWRRHPDCTGLPDAAACWKAIQHQLVITPASIAADPDVAMVRSAP